MRKTILLVWIVLLIGNTGGRCQDAVLKDHKMIMGRGQKTILNYEVRPFTGLEINIPLKVTLVIADSSIPGIQFYGYANILPHVRTKIIDQTLIIYTDLKEGWETEDESPLKAEVTMPAISELTIGGSASVFIKGTIDGDEFRLNIPGAGDVVIEKTRLTKLNARITGLGNVTVKDGSTQFSILDITGSGKIKAYPMKTEETYISISGTGECEISASEKLETGISGTGNIRYKGRPELKDNTSVKGRVVHVN